MELEYQKLWKGFFESIAIDARKNPEMCIRDRLKDMESSDQCCDFFIRKRGFDFINNIHNASMGTCLLYTSPEQLRSVYRLLRIL